MDSSHDQEAGAYSFSQLQRFVADNVRKGHAVSGAALIEAFQVALADCQVVSFDVFDTLLVRRVHQPADVFLHLEKTDAFRRHGPWPAPVWQLRAKAENQARRQLHQSTGSGEVTLEEIYAAFCDLSRLPREDAAGLVRAEEEIERRLCHACAAITALYERAVAAGKRIIFVSDTYHHARFLQELLTARGFRATSDVVFASSDLRLNKQSGQLFPQLLRRIGLNPEVILHVGDHPISDFERPRALGIQAILHSHRASSMESSTFISADLAPLQSFLRGSASIEIKCHEPVRDFWWLLGYNIFGPLLTGFCMWLERSFRMDRIEHAWFLLRDGEIFQRVHKTLFAGRKATPTATLPSSRRAYLLPVLEVAPKLALSGLMSGIETKPAREYLERLHLPADSFREEFIASGFSSLGELIEGRTQGERLKCLIEQPRVHEALVERSRQERDLIMDFFQQEGLRSNRRIALVDLGWRGSIHKATHLLLASGGPAMVTGYYLATRAAFGEDSIPGLASRSFLMHSGKPDDIARKMAPFPPLLEIICSSSSGSLINFDRAGGRVKGVFQEADASHEQHRQIAACHDGSVAFAQEFVKSAPGLKLDDIPPVVAGEAFFRLISQPTKEEATKLGGLTFSDNAGSMTSRHCARFRSPSDPASLLEDYHKAYWKPGLLAQPSPEAAALRTLLSLMQE
jgi:HAD superfamily hydrolase (TIGR01549 family)